MTANSTSRVEEAAEQYNVVVNHEEQYSIWPIDREIPLGWRAVGTSGSKEICLKYIEEVWTDMRPLSLRKAMEAASAAGETADLTEPDPDPQEESLVSRLSQGEHKVRLARGKAEGIPELRQSITRGYVFVEFTGTRGGTELGIRLDRENCDLAEADFENRKGHIQLTGRLVLDYVPVCCRISVDLSTLEGTGNLTVEEASVAS